MKRFLSEPLVHFSVLGALLFSVYGFLNRESDASPQEIVVSPGQIEHLVTTFSRTWQRPPTKAEVEGLIDQFVREEVFSREAVKLGLDRNDTVIRRRLQQKMEFVSDDLVSTAEPTETDLAKYLAEHPDEFREEDRFTFRQVFLNGEKRGNNLESDAAMLLAELKLKGAGADVAELGDATLLPASMTNEPVRRIENAFGREFVAGLAQAKTGEWSGPVLSAFGSHLVRVEQRAEGGVPDLAEVRDAVQREWENARRTGASRQFYEDLRKQYRVTINWPEAEPNRNTASR